MTNKYFLFLDDDIYHPDDIRNPEIYYPLIGATNVLEKMKDYDVVKFATVEEAISWIELSGCPSFISFDNDLQQKLEGKDLAKWIIEKDLDNNQNFIPNDFEFFVHSQNIAAKKYINGLLEPYLASKQVISHVKNLKKP